MSHSKNKTDSASSQWGSSDARNAKSSAESGKHGDPYCYFGGVSVFDVFSILPMQSFKRLGHHISSWDLCNGVSSVGRMVWAVLAGSNMASVFELNRSSFLLRIENRLLRNRKGRVLVGGVLGELGMRVI